MSEYEITEQEAEFFLNMEKIKVNNKEWDLPDLGRKISVPIISLNKKEHFWLDISRKRVNLKKQKYQTRFRESIILARLDLGNNHRNPDGEEIGSPHLHLYKEGYNDKWAYPVPKDIFKDTNNAWETLHDFMQYCQIIEVPNFRRGLFT
ncbi:MAG TPA: hypothetical protein LFV66_00435 [Rickettsia endosymbiont of Bembidion lapponicum]|nr:hypothetical protein [Rickettsia endosymbiont of Bembidion lapponicum]